MTIPNAVEVIQAAPTAYAAVFCLGAAAGCLLSFLFVNRMLRRAAAESDARLQKYRAEWAQARADLDALAVQHALAIFRRAPHVREAEHVLGGYVLGGGPDKVRAAFRTRLKGAQRDGRLDHEVIKKLLEAKRVLLAAEERLST